MKRKWPTHFAEANCYVMPNKVCLGVALYKHPVFCADQEIEQEQISINNKNTNAQKKVC